MTNRDMQDFWSKKKVLITGHTGFKGSWLTLLLNELGAKVYGFSDSCNYKLYSALSRAAVVDECIADILEVDKLKRFISRVKPNVIFHLAAQPVVINSYHNPLETFHINIIGSANVLEVCRNFEEIEDVIIVTSDKCYENREWLYPYREVDRLGGHDPYSASKACTELISKSMADSFRLDFRVTTVRAGNVVGGQDWTEHRIIPDFYRSVCSGRNLEVRNPLSVRPWQHVLEPLWGYISIPITNTKSKFETFNFGPNNENILTVKEFISKLKEIRPLEVIHANISTEEKFHEAGLLALDSSKARNLIGWKPILSIEKTVKWIDDGYMASYENDDELEKVILAQIRAYVQEHLNK